MIVGLLSDTHADVSRTEVAMRILLDAGVDVIVHCGDIGSEAVLVEMASAIHARKVPVYAVLGNVDEWSPPLQHFPVSTGVKVARTHRLDLAGRSAVVVHGHEYGLLGAATADPTLDYVFTGHTHQRADSLPNRPRVINPGAVYRSSQPGVAVLDTETERVRWIDLRP